MPVVRSYRHMLMKNIVYTGITRAKESLILCGDAEAFYESLEKEGIQRRTSLYEMIRLLFGRESGTENDGAPPAALTEETMFEIPAMINMEDVTPYDFI
jgi:exodeoxyribonuclease V alpha subunit